MPYSRDEAEQHFRALVANGRAPGSTLLATMKEDHVLTNKAKTEFYLQRRINELTTELPDMVALAEASCGYEERKRRLATAEERGQKLQDELDVYRELLALVRAA